MNCGLPVYAPVAFTAIVLVVIHGPMMSANEPAYSKPPNHGGVYVIAHRGAHTEIPENTLASYRRAIELGADFVEIDLRTTSDGQLVSIHNSAIDKYVIDGTKGNVRELTLAAIKRLDIGSRIGSQWSGERVPTLEEILKLCKNKIGIYLDLKDAAIPQVVRTIKKHDMQQSVVWCIQPDQVAELRSACPECIPMPDPGSAADVAKLLTATAARIVAPVWRDFSSTFAAQCHATGTWVFVDEQESSEENWRLALDWGADGIQTDAPERLIEFLRMK